MQLVHIGVLVHVQCPGNNVIEHYTYFVSGQPSYLTANTMDNRFLFKGSIFIPQAEIYDMRNRFYHPNLGRFMQCDPIGFDAGDMNLLRYCGDDPVDRSDPMGLEDFDNLQEAIGFAKTQVRERAFGPNARKESHKDFYGGPKTHSVGVGISRQGGKFVTSEPSYGEFKQELVRNSVGRLEVQRDGAGKPVWYETESYPSGTFMKIHSHNNKTGVATYDFSKYDRALAKGGEIVEKITESDGKVERIGSNHKGGIRRMDPSAPIKRSDYSASSSSAGNGAQTASDVEARQQAAANRGVGVPSLGAEAVNFAPGRP